MLKKIILLSNYFALPAENSKLYGISKYVLRLKQSLTKKQIYHIIKEATNIEVQRINTSTICKTKRSFAAVNNKNKKFQVVQHFTKQVVNKKAIIFFKSSLDKHNFTKEIESNE